MGDSCVEDDVHSSVFFLLLNFVLGVLDLKPLVLQLSGVLEDLESLTWCE